MRFAPVLVFVFACSSSPPATRTASPEPSNTSSAAKQPLYSCFSYLVRDNPEKKFDCYLNEECPRAAEKAKASDAEYHQKFGGPPTFTAMSECVPTQTVWCFHRAEQGDTCSPTADACNAGREYAQRNDIVDSACTQR